MRVALRSLAVILALGYPLAVYFGLTHFGTRYAALSLLAIALVHAWLSRRPQLEAAGHTAARAGARPPWSGALIASLCALAFALDERRYVLFTPVLINAALFITFFGSLRTGPPIVERFARIQVPDLSPAEVIYCRRVTKVWSAFFVLNGATAAALAALGDLSLWTLFTGLISYILIGVLGASEYIVRKYRFGRFGRGLHDRLLRALLPARTPP